MQTLEFFAPWNVFLADIRRVANDCIKLGQGHGDFVPGSAARAQAGYNTEFVPPLRNRKEVVPCDVRIIFFVFNVPRSKVQRREMRRKHRDVATKDFPEKLLMRFVSVLYP